MYNRISSAITTQGEDVPNEKRPRPDTSDSDTDTEDKKAARVMSAVEVAGAGASEGASAGAGGSVKRKAEGDDDDAAAAAAKNPRLAVALEVRRLIGEFNNPDLAVKIPAMNEFARLLETYYLIGGKIAEGTDEDTVNQTKMAIPKLVLLLRDGHAQVKAFAAKALSLLARDDKNQISIAAIPGSFQGLVGLLKEARLFQELVGLLKNADTNVRGYAAEALARLAEKFRNKISIAATAGSLQALVDLLKDADTNVRHNAIEALSLLAENSKNKISIAAIAGSLRALIDLL